MITQCFHNISTNLLIEYMNSERVGNEHDEKWNEEGGQRPIDEEILVKDGACVVV